MVLYQRSESRRMRKSGVPDQIVELYTDVLAHRFEPNGSRIACGTTTGNFYVINPNGDKKEVSHCLTTSVPSNDAVLGIDWGGPGIFVGVKSGFFMYPVKESTGAVVDKPVFTDCFSDVMDIRWLPESQRVIAACEDGKIRVVDIASGKFIRTIDCQEGSWDRTAAAVEVLAVSDELLGCGKQDGTISVFDKDLRSAESLWKLSVGSKLAPGLALTKDSTWLATGTHGRPIVYNFRTRVALPAMESDLSPGPKLPLSIYGITFDNEGTLWWGGSGSCIFGSDCLSRVTSSLQTSYGDEVIYHVFSIANGSDGQMSVAGSSNGVLFTDNGKYWDTYISL